MIRLGDRQVRDLSLNAAADLVLGILAADESIAAGEVRGLFDQLTADVAVSLRNLGRAPGSPPQSSLPPTRLVLVHGAGGSPAATPEKVA